MLCYLSAFNIFSDLIKLRSNHPYVVLAYIFGSIFWFAVYLLVIVLLSQRTNERPNECRSWSIAFACKFFRSMFINFHYKNQIEWSISLHYMHVITVLFEIPVVRQHLGIQIGCFIGENESSCWASIVNFRNWKPYEADSFFGCFSTARAYLMLCETISKSMRLKYNATQPNELSSCHIEHI